MKKFKLSSEQRNLVKAKLQKQGLVSEKKSSILPLPKDKITPLSYNQEWMWILEEIASPAYNTLFALRLEGNLNKEALQQSIEALIERHEILRTTFPMNNGKAIQVVNSIPKISLVTIDLTKSNRKFQQEEIQKIAQAEVEPKFNLSQDLLCRFVLIKCSQNEHHLLMVIHHILKDYWSLEILLNDLSNLYTAIIQNLPPQLSPLPIQYADFAYWERQALSSSSFDKDIIYWQNKLKNLPENLNLPRDYYPNHSNNFKGRRAYFDLSPDLTEKLRNLSNAEGVTLFTTLFAAFKLLLYRLCQQDDIIIGFPVSTRHQTPEVKHLIGSFINVLPLRTELSGQSSFRELIQQIKNGLVEAYEHQKLPNIKIFEALQTVSKDSPSSLYQALFSFRDKPFSPIHLTDLTIHFSEFIDPGTAKVPLSLLIVNQCDSLVGYFEYDTSLFSQATIETIINCFQTLLEGIIHNPNGLLSELPILTQVEKNKILFEWNNTVKDYPKEKCIHQLFEEQVEKTPDNIALVYENDKITYQELNKKANQLAHYLKQLGVKPDTLVGVCVERSIEMFIGLLGILKAGGAYVPLDANYPLERINYIIEDTQIGILLTETKLQEKFLNQEINLICLDSDGLTIIKEKHNNLKSELRSSLDLAYVIYTSGSTGKPKGVTVSHQSVNRLICNTNYIQIKESDRIAQISNHSFDAATFEIWGALLSGASLIIIEKELALSPQKLSQYIQKNKITILFLTTALFNQISSIYPQAFSQLKYLLFGGESVEPKWVKEILNKGKPQNLLHVYGPTENTTFSTWYQVETISEMTTVPIGRPISNTQIYILDSYLQPVPIGVTGEIYLGGDGLARGYLNRPKLTAEKFIANPFGEGKLYKTGDLAKYLHDGNIEYIGRIDNQVKIRGFRIELGEIEATLNQSPNIKQTIVISREYQSGDKRLVAYIIPHLNSSPTQTELRSFLQEKLPEYMIPSVFVTLDSFPLTPNGKIDRKALPEPQIKREEAIIKPTTATEEIIASIWNQLLEVEASIKDNFFTLGGNSLLATQLISRIGDTFNLEISLKSLFENPTINQLSSLIDNQRKPEEKLPSLEKIKQTEDIQISFAQSRLWFLEQLEEIAGVYNISIAFKLQGNLDIEILEKALNILCKRHESLRTGFEKREGIAVQKISKEVKIKISLVDLKESSNIEKERATKELIKAEQVQGFNLEIAPLLRVKLIIVSDTSYILLLTIHHIISDGWSLGIMTKELSIIYQSLLNKKAIKLPSLSIEYTDFSQWQRQWLQGENSAKQLNYWQKQLSGIPPVLELPIKQARPPVQTFLGSHKKFSIGKEITQELKKLSEDNRVTLFMTLIAAFGVLLSGYTHQDDLVMGSPIANRNQSQIESIIGFFANTLPLRIDIKNNPKFSELLERVRVTCLDAYAHQDIPFEKLVEELNPERNLSYNPLFQVMFALQNVPQSTLEIPEVTTEIIPIERHFSKFDLSLFITETEAGLTGEFEYNTDLFEPETIERLAKHYQTLLQGIIENPERKVKQLPLLTPQEKTQILVEWNNTVTDYPKEKCIHQLFEEQVEKTPDNIAVIDQDKKITYQELNKKANQLAHYLKQLGVKPDTLVGVCVERSIEMFIGLLGILKAGGAYVPLDANYPLERINYIIEDTQIGILLTETKLQEKFLNQEINLICLDSDGLTIIKEKHNNLKSELRSSLDLAYVIYTSGSTGKPKGVTVSHQSVNRLICNTNYIQIKESDRIAQISNHSFDAATFEIWGALLSGASLIIIEKELALSPQKLSQYIQKNKITILFLTTALFNQISSIYPQAFSQLKYLLFGGESVEPKWVKEILNKGKPQNLLHVYGPTENTTFSTWYQVETISEMTTVPIGRPISNTQIYILDFCLQPVPIGVTGEIYLGGDGLVRGYLNRPKLTAEKFIANPFGEGRLYKTGDLAKYLADGNIEYIGRIDNQVKIRGFRIELGEIEATLNQHPDIKDSLVMATENQGKGKYLITYVIRENQQLKASEIEEFLQIKLPDYMIPSVYAFIDKFPLNNNGKIDTKALPNVSLETCRENKLIPPSNKIENKLSKIWQDVLGIEKIGIKDNFFTLGGHSLLATQILWKATEEFDINIPLKVLFENPTIEKIALYIYSKANNFNQKKLSNDTSVIVINEQGNKVPLYFINSTGIANIFKNYLDQSQPLYSLNIFGLTNRINKPFNELTMKDFAQYIVEDLLISQPHNSYKLVGYCQDGALTLEIAQKLKSKGYTVDLLCLIDVNFDREQKQRLPVFHYLQMMYEFKLTYIKSKIKYYFDNFLKKIKTNKFNESRNNYQISDMKNKIKLDEELYSHYLKLFLEYKPSCYQGKIVSLESKEFSSLKKPTLSLIAEEGFEDYSINSLHQTLFEEPYIKLLAQKIKLYL